MSNKPWENIRTCSTAEDLVAELERLNDAVPLMAIYDPSRSMILAALAKEAQRMRAPKPEGKFVVREYDWHDGWIDVTGPLTRAEADARWNKETGNGTHHTKYEDGQYFAVFPADTRMIYTAHGEDDR